MTHLAYFSREPSGARDDGVYVGLRIEVRILRAVARPRQRRSVGNCSLRGAIADSRRLAQTRECSTAKRVAAVREETSSLP
jgi:hypothetical protein